MSIDWNEEEPTQPNRNLYVECAGCGFDRDCENVAELGEQVWCCSSCDPMDAAERHWIEEDYKARLLGNRDNTPTDPCMSCISCFEK